MKSYSWKTARLLVGAIIALVLSGVLFSAAFAMPIAPVASSDSVVLSAPSKIPSWSVYEERASDGVITNYAYAKADVDIGTIVAKGKVINLINKQKEVFQARITSVLAIKPQSAGTRNPGRVWITFERIGPDSKSWLPGMGPAVIFKWWILPPK